MALHPPNSVIMGDAGPSTADRRDAATRKRPRSSEEAVGSADDLRRVAEIVMVLSAMARMRGGREPTPTERALVAEARGSLALACEGVRPRDLFSTEAVRVVVEDLGLNRSGGDHGVRFRPPRLSIADKLMLTKYRMEGPKEIPTFSASVSPGATSLAASRIPQDKSNVMTLPAGSVQGAGSVLAPGASASKQTQIGHSQAGSSSSNPLPVPPSMQSHTDAAHLRINMRAHDQASLPGYVSRQTPTSSPVQSTYAAALDPPAKYGQLSHAPIKSGGTPGLHPILTAQQEMNKHETRPPIIQTGAGAALIEHQPPQGLAYAHPSSSMDNHNDVAESVQKILQAKVSVHTSWTPPSIEYMNKPINCQICAAIITDVQSLLVCDSCERGYHLKCLQYQGTKGILKQEWHCKLCLAASHGKPLAPKYGRVTRALPGQRQKAASSADSSQVPPTKKPQSPEANFNQQETLANGKSTLPQNTNSVNMGANPDSASVLDLRTSVTEVQSSTPVDEIKKELSKSETKKEGTCTGTESLHSSEMQDPVDTTTSRGSESLGCDGENEGVSQHDMKPTSESNLHPDVVAERTSEHPTNEEVESTDHPQTTSDSQIANKVMLSNSEASPIQQHELTNSCSNELKEQIPQKETPDNMDSNPATSDELNKLQEIPNGFVHLQGKSMDHGKPLKLDSGNVEWVGNIVQVVEEKARYLSCRVNGVLYRLHDNVLVTLDSDKFIPAKLQSFWEDEASGSKWTMVNTYLFPRDLPESCNQPCNPAKSEVYASDNCETIMAGLISGPCDVLQTDRFSEESDKRTQLDDTDKKLHPIFMCNWIYHESTCNFEPLKN